MQCPYARVRERVIDAVTYNRDSGWIDAEPGHQGGLVVLRQRDDCRRITEDAPDDETLVGSEQQPAKPSRRTEVAMEVRDVRTTHQPREDPHHLWHIGVGNMH